MGGTAGFGHGPVALWPWCPLPDIRQVFIRVFSQVIPWVFSQVFSRVFSRVFSQVFSQVICLLPVSYLGHMITPLAVGVPGENRSQAEVSCGAEGILKTVCSLLCGPCLLVPPVYCADAQG